MKLALGKVLGGLENETLTFYDAVYRGNSSKPSMTAEIMKTLNGTHAREQIDATWDFTRE